MRPKVSSVRERSFAQLLSQLAARAHTGFGGLFLAEDTAFQKVLQDLFFQIHTVRDHHDTALLELRQQDEGLCQHDHGVGLAAARGMPDDAAAPLAALAALQALQHGPQAEHLLITGRQSVQAVAAGLEKGEEAHAVQKTRGMQQARHAAILPGQHAVLCDMPGIPLRGRTQGQDGRGIFRRGALLPGADARVRRFLFPSGGTPTASCRTFVLSQKNLKEQ